MDKPTITVQSTPTVSVSVEQKHTTIPNDYSKLKNLPTLNGIKVVGELTSEDIKVLSAVADDYEFADLENCEGKAVIFQGDGTTAVISIAELLEYIKSFDCGYAETIKDDGDVKQELKPNVFYSFTGALTSLTLTFGAMTDGKQNEYMGEFTVGDTIPTVVFPDGVKWVNEDFPELETGKTYQFSVVNNIGVVIGV